MLINLGVFVLAVSTVLHDRWIRYRGPGNITEFIIYAMALGFALVILWWTMRSEPWSAAVVLTLEIGLALHFAGGLVAVGDGRLYDVVVAGVRYDKVVHFFNAFVAALIIRRLLRFRDIRLGILEPLAVLLIAFGFCALWEVVEYLVVRTVPAAGVGEYDNNMQDLLANLIGAATAAIFDRRGRMGDPA